MEKHSRAYSLMFPDKIGESEPNAAKVLPITKDRGIDDRPDLSGLPRSGRVSVPGESSPNVLGITESMSARYKVMNHTFLKQVIPVIRGLCYLNPDLSQALDNIVSLANTGHKVFFDRNVSSEQVDAMRNHLVNKRKLWAGGQAGMDGLVNKFFSQLMISGAISNEWVPNNTLTGIESCILLDPENIVFKLDGRGTFYQPYQEITNILRAPKNVKDGLVKLNTNTYQYYALNGDNELPYGIPPYLPALPRVNTQNKMNTNIDYIVDTMGLLGFLEVLLEKPMATGVLSNPEKYQAHLDGLLNKAKELIVNGVKDGVVVGFKGDHEFNFNSAAKNYESVATLYQENELQVASGTKQDAALWGRGYSTSESQISVVFMKMLSQLRNSQNVVKTNLEFGYGLELRMAGFKFDYLKVQFNRSTIQDDLKYQQAEEYKIKNVTSKYIMGIIDLDQAADELGYETPAETEPLVSAEVLAGGKDPLPTTASGAPTTSPRSGQKKKSEKKSKEKRKP